MSAGILTLVRHGETSANLDGVWHGSTDTPLTERGRTQAERVGAYIGETYPDSVALYASPRTRTLDTAAPIARALGLEVQVEPGLAEYDLGDWEGRSYRELAETEKLWERMKVDPDFAPRGGESPIQVRDRMTGALRRIEAAHRGDRVVVVGERAVPRCAVRGDGEPAHALLSDLHGVEALVAHVHGEPTDLTDRVFAPNFLRVIPRQPERTPLTAGLLVSDAAEDEIAFWGHPEAVKQDEGHRLHRDHVLHVDGPAAPDESVMDFTGEGGVGPDRRIRGHDIQMAAQEDGRAPVAVAKKMQIDEPDEMDLL